MTTALTLSDGFARWLDHKAALATLGMGEASTVAGLRRRIVPVVAAFRPDMGATLTYAAVELYIARRLSYKRAPVTVAKEVAAYRAMATWAAREGLMPALGAMPSVKTERTEQRMAGTDEITRVLDALTPLHREACAFMLATGLSPHELARLEPQDVDLGRRVVRIGMRPGFKVKVAARRREIPLNAMAVRIARAALDRSPMFPSRDAMAKQMQRCRPRSGPAITPKTMRSGFASMLAGAKKPVPEHVLQGLLGHAPGSPVTRRHYVRSTGDEQRAAVTAHRLELGL